MTEQHTIHLPVIRYRDKAGNPTCAVDFGQTGDAMPKRSIAPSGSAPGNLASLPKHIAHPNLPTTWMRRDGPRPGMGWLSSFDPRRLVPSVGAQNNKETPG